MAVIFSDHPKDRLVHCMVRSSEKKSFQLQADASETIERHIVGSLSDTSSCTSDSSVHSNDDFLDDITSHSRNKSVSLGLFRRRNSTQCDRNFEIQNEFRYIRKIPKKRNRRRQTWWLIPADHPLKITWDVITVFLSFLSIYDTHRCIRDRSYEMKPLTLFVDVWFGVDVLLNFFTDYKTDNGEIIRDERSVWARYLTSWFVIDVLALFRFESILVKPIVEMQKKRGFFKKTLFRSSAILRLMKRLRRYHVQAFGRVASKAKYAGVGSRKLLRVMIKYVPKYLVFLRNMKLLVAVRLLRNVHWFWIAGNKMCTVFGWILTEDGLSGRSCDQSPVVKSEGKLNCRSKFICSDDARMEDLKDRGDERLRHLDSLLVTPLRQPARSRSDGIPKRICSSNAKFDKYCRNKQFPQTTVREYESEDDCLPF